MYVHMYYKNAHILQILNFLAKVPLYYVNNLLIIFHALFWITKLKGYL